MNDRKLAAWAVHLYTAMGGVIGMMALFAAADGQIRSAFLLLCLTAFIDATDGILARKVNVKQVLPNFDGSMVDNVIDVLTYVWVPVFIMWSQNLLPHPIWLAVPIIASLYAYGQVNMKSDDAFFMGFPSYWNFIALYLFWLRPEPTVAVLTVVIPGVLSFIPTRYLYPSKNRYLAKLSWVLGLIWGFLVLYLLTQENPDQRLVVASLYYPIYYLALSFYIDIRMRQGKVFA